mgnify:CR=1 FL=1
MLPRIYCDMDGVLCDFKKRAEQVTGKPISQWMYASKSEKCLVSQKLVHENRNRGFADTCAGRHTTLTCGFSSTW